MERQAVFTLLGSLNVEPEIDEQDQQFDNNIEEASDIYTINTVIQGIGTPEFKANFENFYNDIVKMNSEKRNLFTSLTLTRVKDIYDFEFFQNTASETFDFLFFLFWLKWLEYDNVSFLSLVWKKLKKDPLRVDYSKISWKELQRCLLEVATMYNFFIQSFVLSSKKNVLIKWFITKSKNAALEISIFKTVTS